MIFELYGDEWVSEHSLMIMYAGRQKLIELITEIRLIMEQGGIMEDRHETREFHSSRV